MIDATVIALRGVQYAAAVVALGLPLFLIYARGSSAAHRITALAAMACGWLAAAALAAVSVQTAMMAGGWAAALDPTALSYVAQSTGLGRANIARAVLAIVGAALLIAVRKTARERPARLWPAVAALSAAIASFAWSGHGAATEGVAGLAHVISDAAHAVAAAVWLGALGGFLLILSRSEKAELDIAARALVRFATIGTATVIVLVVTGLINTAILVGVDGLSDLVISTWGQLLIVKLVLFLVMLGLAAHNRFALTPALSRAEDTAARDLAAGRLRRSVGLEALAGMALLGMVAALGVQMPPGSM